MTTESRPRLAFGSTVRVKCSATGRYFGTFNGMPLALFISAQDNDICVDEVDYDIQPQANLPAVHDSHLAAAATAARYVLRKVSP